MDPPGNPVLAADEGDVLTLSSSWHMPSHATDIRKCAVCQNKRKRPLKVPRTCASLWWRALFARVCFRVKTQILSPAPGRWRHLDENLGLRRTSRGRNWDDTRRSGLKWLKAAAQTSVPLIWDVLRFEFQVRNFKARFNGKSPDYQNKSSHYREGTAFSGSLEVQTAAELCSLLFWGDGVCRMQFNKNLSVKR